jgi:hypothetical protein
MDHLGKSAISGPFLDLFSPDSHELFAAVHPPLKGSGGLVFAGGLGDPLSVGHEAGLGQREFCWLLLHLSETEKSPL